MSKPKLASMRWIRSELKDIDEFIEIRMEQRDDNTVFCLFEHKKGFIAFDTDIPSAKKLVEEIKFTKSLIKILIGYFF